MTQVPNSAGDASPRLKAPPGACDSHLHIYDPQLKPMWPKLRVTANASTAEYRELQQRIGTTRAIVVQPAAYGTDNRVTTDAVAQLGVANARGIAVLHPSASDAELQALHTGGIRGLRFTLHDPTTAVTSPDMIAPLAARIAALGWHTQLHLMAAQIAELSALIESLPGTIVIDHMGRLPPADGVKHPAFGVVRRLLDSGRGWVKLSGAYLNTDVGPPRYADATRVAREYVKAAPERCVWGSDWPHPTEKTKPDDAILLDLLQEWARDEATRRKILVDNPAALYGFAA